jgi:hypothetical protein
MVAEHVSTLRELTYDQLKEIQEKPVEYVAVEKRRGRIATYLDKDMPSQGIRVVVQGFLKRRFFPMIWDEAIDGFYKYPDQTTVELDREDKRDFD